MVLIENILTEQLKLMASKLTEEGARIPEEPLIVYYDNGGGQSGIRENPFYSAYEKLLASYIKTLTATKDEIDEETYSTLDEMKKKFKLVR